MLVQTKPQSFPKKNQTNNKQQMQILTIAPLHCNTHLGTDKGCPTADRKGVRSKITLMCHSGAHEQAIHVVV